MVDFAKMLAERRERHNIENRPRLDVSISVAGSDYAVKFDYNAALLRDFKDAIPESERAWHKGRKVWLFSPDELRTVIDVLTKHNSQAYALPTEKPVTPETIEKTFLLEYLGTTKDRGKRTSAYGSVNGEWSAEFPEDILRGFFEGRETNQKPDGLQTLYQVLCVFESVDSDQIRKAYKRLALQWHPDTCSEPDAHERFIKINEAYKVLIDPEKKRRYDAGLYFERQQTEPAEWSFRSGRSSGYGYGYRSPLRCGQITAKGTVRLMRFIVSEILKWDDVTNDRGQVMSSTWPKGADTFQILWV